MEQRQGRARLHPDTCTHVCPLTLVSLEHSLKYTMQAEQRERQDLEVGGKRGWEEGVGKILGLFAGKAWGMAVWCRVPFSLCPALGDNYVGFSDMSYSLA